MASDPPAKQLLHLVFGGELTSLDANEFRDLSKAKAQQTVDNAHMRYFIVHMHRLLDPDEEQRRAEKR